MSSGLYDSITGGAVGGLVASLVYALFAAAYRYWRRPELFAYVDKFRTNDGFVEFDLVVKNVGESAFIEPALNVDGFKENTVFSTVGGMAWMGEDKFAYTHHRSLVPRVSIRLPFTVQKGASLPATIIVAVLHREGVEESRPIDLTSLRSFCATG